jgi:DNA repair exonuclease SbcCD ATPase subunit
MKHVNKILLFLACISLSSTTLTMGNLDLAEQIEDLKDEIEKLQERLETLEKAKQSGETTTPAVITPTGTFRKCHGDSCKGIKRKKYRHLRKHGHKKGYHCKGGVCKKRTPGGIVGGIAAGHNALQDQFLALEKKYDIETTQSEREATHRVRGPQGNQVQFNAVRAQLNTALSKPTVSDDEIEQIEQNIAKLKKLNPARWPRAEDYEAVLKALEARQ